MVARCHRQALAGLEATHPHMQVDTGLGLDNGETDLSPAE
jgi:hypothetical protein